MSCQEAFDDEKKRDFADSTALVALVAHSDDFDDKLEAGASKGEGR
jgi:hypothetical protein